MFVRRPSHEINTVKVLTGGNGVETTKRQRESSMTIGGVTVNQENREVQLPPRWECPLSYRQVMSSFSAGFCRCSLPTTYCCTVSVDCEVRCSSSVFCLSLSEQGREERGGGGGEGGSTVLNSEPHAHARTRGMHESHPSNGPLISISVLVPRSCTMLPLATILHQRN